MNVARWTGGLALLSATAFAQGTPAVEGGQGWSLLSGQTVGAGANLFEGQAGFPGLSAGFLHGINSNIDLGVSFTFNYGLEGDVQALVSGIKPEGVARFALFDNGRYNLGLRAGLGPFFYFPSNGPSLNGFSIPVSLVLGIPVGSAIMLNAGVDLPFFVVFGPGGGPVLPILLGGGGEYFLDSHLSVSFNTRMGPALTPVSSISGNGSAASYFTFEALLGVAYRL
jgi:hypothetical protein